jgi:hypothetical protein
MFSPELKKIFDETVKEAIDQIPVVSLGFKGSGLDLKKYVDNEMDFYLGVTLATIIERYDYKVIGKNNNKFTLQEATFARPDMITSVYDKIPILKEEIKSKIGL